jgi:CIC family chloride channel protein
MDAKSNAVTGANPQPASSRKLFFFRPREDQMIFLLALAIGALTGLATVAFIVLTERLGLRLYPVRSVAWRRVAIPICGSLGIGYLLYRYFPEARGSGVPQTKAALFARNGVITLRTVLGKFFCTSVTLASGIPLGREGPAVQVGGGIASVLGRRFGLGPEKVKALLPAGAAAAIAAAFNTPLAAVLFALEEVMGDLNAPVLGSVVLASATSWVVLRLLLGNDPLFTAPAYKLIHPLELGIYAILGVVGGLVSVAFTKLLLGLRARMMRLPKRTVWFQPVLGGVLVGCIGLYVPQALGVGYSYVGDALNEKMTLELMALLVVLKLVGSAVSYATGNAGGIFGPSLFIGAMLGGAVGSVAHHLLPAYTATPGAYALVGMGTAFAGIVRAPMTSVMMIFETTRDYTVIVPLMISNMVSLFVSSKLQPEPIYIALALQDGIHLPTSESRYRRSRHQVNRAMKPATEILSASMMLQDVIHQIEGSSCTAWPVMDQQELVGVLSRTALEMAGKEMNGKMLGDLFAGQPAFPHVHSDQGLDVALDRMGTAGMDLLPVVSRANVRRLEGIVTVQDVLSEFGCTFRYPSKVVEKINKT